MQPVIDGYWLPKSIRREIITPDTVFAHISFLNGRTCSPETPGSATARYPVFSSDQWVFLRARLGDNRRQISGGEAICTRLSNALNTAAEELLHPKSDKATQALEALPGYTGFSPAMLSTTLKIFDWIQTDHLLSIMKHPPARKAASDWLPFAEIPGRLRFFPKHTADRLSAYIPVMRDKPLYKLLRDRELLIGIGAGNIPGSGLLIALLGLAAGMAGGNPPAAIIRNSRSEPIFSPLVLQAMEDADPELVSSLALLIWDFDGSEIERLLFKNADLAIAAASDSTIGAVQSQIEHASKERGQKIPFHAHGHKISFTAIAKESLARSGLDSGDALSLDKVALLAALDSALWDQHGCLSSRVHFVETGAEGSQLAREYAASLTKAMAVLADRLPRGAWGMSELRDRFDYFKQLEGTGLVEVLSRYEDHFLVAIDHRKHDDASFGRTVNDCMGRVVIVQPVTDLMEVPKRYLKHIPAQNLQSLSVALAGESLDSRFLQFAAVCGKCGVTAIRTVGRAAFPQLAYSWDGFLPLDLVQARPTGYFTTIEFDDPQRQMLETYRRATACGLTG